jgi:hypothetical protein
MYGWSTEAFFCASQRDFFTSLIFDVGLANRWVVLKDNNKSLLLLSYSNLVFVAQYQKQTKKIKTNPHIV